MAKTQSKIEAVSSPKPRLSKKGDNGGPALIGGIDGEMLKNYVERLERLGDERDIITEDMREVMADAKGNGFDPKTIREIIKWRAKEASLRENEETMFGLYKQALGLVPKDDDENMID